VKEILDYFLMKEYPKEGEHIGYISKAHQMILNYYHPNKYNEIFLGIDWLSRHFFKLVTADDVYNLLCRILLEQSFLFVADSIQDLTTLVLSFSYLISPFKWPFIIIPNLPIDLIGMTDSPVPYLIGILGISNFKKYNLGSDIPANIVIYQNKHLHMTYKEDVVFPRLGGVKQVIKTDLDMANYYLGLKMYEEHANYCQKIYKNLYEIIKSTLADPLERLFKMNVNVCIYKLIL
jgi:hypothetical protein